MRHGFHFHYTEILSPSRFDRHPDVPPHRFLISLDRFSGNPFSLAFSLNVPPLAVAFPTSGSSIWKPGIPLLFPPAYGLPVYILLSFFDISLDNSCLYSTIYLEHFQLRLLYFFSIHSLLLYRTASSVTVKSSVIPAITSSPLST